MNSFEEVVDAALKEYFSKLNTAPPKDEDDPLEKFYNDNSKLTFGERQVGAKKIVQQLRKEKKEFTLDTYSFGSVDANHVIITGQYLLGTSKLPFTIALEAVEREDQMDIFITNQIMIF